MRDYWRAYWAELERLDARQCRTGYACGSACISLAKECRKTPKAATGKERLRRIQELAAGNISEGKGLARLRQSEAGAKLQELQGQRSVRAQELIGQRQQRKPVAQPSEPTTLQVAGSAQKNGDSKSPKPNPNSTNPRKAAETVESSGDYEFARKSSVQNVGEDFGDSARHRRNMFRSLDEAEAAGEGSSYANRDSLLKNNPTDLISTITTDNHLSHLAAHFMLKAFPKDAGDVDSYAQRIESRGELLPGETKEDVAARVRRQYVDAFNEYRQVCQRAAMMDDPRKAEREVIEWTSTQIRLLRGRTLERVPGSNMLREVATGRSDIFNPVANQLVNTYKRLYKTGKTSITGQMNEFARSLKSDQQADWAEGSSQKILERSKEVATRIIEGDSMAAAFGNSGQGKKRFSTADLYVGTASRNGGRPAPETPQGNSDFILDKARFRGVQYGNSVTDEERRHHLKKAAEAMLDLADATGLPDEAIGLKGNLGLAIGARGKGSAMAHYEPGIQVINLTRKKGVGTLAHEWGHALDDYISKGNFLSNETLMYNTYKRKHEADDVSDAMNAIQTAMRDSGFNRRLSDALMEAKKKMLINVDYWRSEPEKFARAFEEYIQYKLTQGGNSNTYLVKSTGHPFWPTKEETEAMAPHFDRLMQAVREKHFSDSPARRDSRNVRIQRMLVQMGESGMAPTRDLSWSDAGGWTIRA